MAQKEPIDATKILLGTLAVAGVISVGLLAPNALGAMAKLGLLPHKRQREVFTAAQKRLLKKGYIANSKGKIRLTQKGKELLHVLELKNYRLKRPKQWDERWRVLVFDIPEKRRKMRDLVRYTLESIGFKYLQDSVWLFPYPTEELVTLLKTNLRIGSELLYLVVDRFEGDSYYTEHFELE